MADELVLEVYRMTSTFPLDERFGLRAQLRRAAVSAATNIVEGCARRSEREYLNFLNIAVGSSAEAQYLIDLSVRLGLLKKDVSGLTAEKYRKLQASLQKLTSSVREP